MAQSRRLKPTGTLAQRLRAAEAALIGSDRYLDVRLDLAAFGPTDDRRKLPTGATILAAGGRWDKTFGRFLDPVAEADVSELAIVGVEESQFEFLEWGAGWLAAYRDGLPRDTTVTMMAGDRRGGKTFIAVAFIIACCIDAPIASDGTPLLAWIVSKSFRERFEIEQWILNRIPDTWYRHLGAPVHEFHFAHGAVLRLISADDDDSTKQGRVDVCFINEPQKLGPRAVANAVLGASDLGGLVILAANPPRGDHSRGYWMFDVKDAIDDERVAQAKGKRVEPLGIRYFHVDSKRNKSIDQVSRRRAGRIAALIDPSIKAGDVEGSWKRPAERALWEFDKHRHLHAVPTVAPALVDVTREIARQRGEWGDWLYVAGVDFDWRPHIVAVIYRIFGSLDDPLFWAMDEFAGEQKWTTLQWIQAFEDWGDPRGYTRESLLFIGDASSSHPRDDDPKAPDERTSFETLEGEQWTIIPPQDHRGRSGAGRARNPFVDARLDLYNDHLRRDRAMIDPVGCPWFSECAREATTERKTGRRKLVHNKWAHAIDAGTYPVWRLAPHPGSKGLDGPPMVTIPIRRFGDDF